MTYTIVCNIRPLAAANKVPDCTYKGFDRVCCLQDFRVKLDVQLAGTRLPPLQMKERDARTSTISKMRVLI